MDNEASVMVCVTQQYECERLIREGRKAADIKGRSLYVVNVQQKSMIGKKFAAEIEYLFSVSKKFDAEMLVFYAEDPVSVITNCIKRYNVKALILGTPKETDSQLAEKINENAKNVEIYTVK